MVRFFGCHCSPRFDDKSSTAWLQHKKVRNKQIFQLLFYGVSNFPTLSLPFFLLTCFLFICMHSLSIQSASNICAIIYICVLVFLNGLLCFVIGPNGWRVQRIERKVVSFLWKNYVSATVSKTTVISSFTLLTNHTERAWIRYRLVMMLFSRVFCDIYNLYFLFILFDYCPNTWQMQHIDFDYSTKNGLIMIGIKLIPLVQFVKWIFKRFKGKMWLLFRYATF